MSIGNAYRRHRKPIGNSKRPEKALEKSLRLSYIKCLRWINGVYISHESTGRNRSIEPGARREKPLLLALLDQAAQDAKTIEAKEADIQAKDLKIGALTYELACYKRIRFSRKNEILAPLQRDVFEETRNTDISVIEAELEQLQDDSPCPTVVRPKRPRAGRQPLPVYLPRIEHRHEPESCCCGHCGRDLVKIGEDITEQLDVELAKFFVHRHIRPQYACRACAFPY